MTRMLSRHSSGYTFGHADIGLQWAMAFASPHQEMGKSPWSLSLDFAYRF